MGDTDTPTPNPQADAPPDDAARASKHEASFLGRIDRWMAVHPWHPRVAPEMVYLLLLMVVAETREWNPLVAKAIYIVQCVLVVMLLWRYRKLTPELSWGFHWAAIPVGLGVCAIWVALGEAMIGLFPGAFDDPGTNYFELYADHGGRSAAWFALSMKLLGMSIVVPMFEELFNRSLLLRSLSSFRKTGIGVVNLLQDMPMLDDLIGESSLAKRAGRHRRTLGDQFEATPLGKLTLFGVTASTVLFMLAHGTRDWPGAIACGVIYCLLLAYTMKRKPSAGLGPVIWAHAITNASLWAYVVFWDQWHYL